MRYLEDRPPNDNVGTPQGPTAVDEDAAMSVDTELRDVRAVGLRLGIDPEFFAGHREHLDG